MSEDRSNRPPEPRPPARWPRRGFLSGALVAAGAAAGWAVRQAGQAPPSDGRTPLDSRFAYDVSEFERTDPALLLYEPAGEFDTGLGQAKRLALWAGRGLVVAGGRELALYDFRGQRLEHWRLDSPAQCLLALNRDALAVGYRDRWGVLDAAGREVFAAPELGARTYLTGIAADQERLFLADAGRREIVVCDRKTGRVLDRFGRKDPERGNPGFNVPSPYFALALGADGHLRVANPGLLRIETYTREGRFVSAWGEPGLRIDRFCGCCNPVFFAIAPGGELITSEKGLTRINVYGRDGGFKGAVAGPDTLTPEKERAGRAEEEIGAGAGFDIALDEEEVLALDPYRRMVRRFRRKVET